MRRGYYKPYKPVAQKKAEVQKKIDKLKKKNPDLSPIVIEGNKIATSWWGLAWNKNLKSYADYANRIGRGSAYLKNGYVIDLQIQEGMITSLVQGSGMYKITIQIDPLPEKQWSKILKICSNKIDSIATLVEGKFPKELAEVFLKQGDGLFPMPREIHLNCSCPDWADMCKHVAATLFGVGRRLDDDPLLFFKLRSINPSELIKKSVDDKMKKLLENANHKSRRAIDDADVSRLFEL